MYDKNNIFARILRSEIASKKVYEDDKILSFYDINPKARVHVLVIPKGEYINFTDFVSRSNDVESFFKCVKHIAEDILGLKDFRLITNNGKGAGQEVPHFHIHILGT
jgi:histidine triad (HIT) family protein